MPAGRSPICALEPGQQLVVVTDGVIEAQGAGERFGEDRLRSELGGATDPTQVVQRVEGSLQAFTEGALDDDVAMLVLAPGGRGRLERAATDSEPRGRQWLTPTWSWSNASTTPSTAAIPRGSSPSATRGWSSSPSKPPARSGARPPTSGREGLREYLADAAQVWEELLVTPSEVEQIGDQLLVRGRVYVRSRELGIRDMPAAWIWGVRDGRFVRGEVFPNPSAAEERFAQLTVV